MKRIIVDEMDDPTKTRRYSLVLVVAVTALIASVTGGVVALAQPDGGEVFTGCLNEKSGVLRGVAVGFEPAKPCSDNDVQITWDRAGPGFEGRIAALEELVAQPTVGAPSPVRLFAAATVDVTHINSSVGPIEEPITRVVRPGEPPGPGYYRVVFGEDVFGDDPPHSTAFISLASNSAYSAPATCTYEVVAANTLEILCWNELSGDPEDAEWSLMVFSANTATPIP